MMTKKQIKLTPKKISNWLTIVTIFLTLVILIFISIFLYKNFYQSITQSKEILILKEKVSPYSVNMQKFNLIIERLTKKTEPKKLDNIISPFR
jgi:hypothetical protein